MKVTVTLSAWQEQALFSKGYRTDADLHLAAQAMIDFHTPDDLRDNMPDKVDLQPKEGAP